MFFFFFRKPCRFSFTTDRPELAATFTVIGSVEVCESAAVCGDVHGCQEALHMLHLTTNEAAI